jgi:hypothetical protein
MAPRVQRCAAQGWQVRHEDRAAPPTPDLSSSSAQRFSSHRMSAGKKASSRRPAETHPLRTKGAGTPQDAAESARVEPDLEARANEHGLQPTCEYLS